MSSPIMQRQRNRATGQHYRRGQRGIHFTVLAVLMLAWLTSTEAFLVTTPDKSSPRSTLFASKDEYPAMGLGQLRSTATTNLLDYDLVRAAASITNEACHLLGVKSVGVDYGLVRTGIATTVGYNPNPLEIICDINSTEVCSRVVEICRSEQADQVVVGLPLHKNGTEAEQTNLTRIFAAELAQAVLRGIGPGCPVYFWDERYTSKEAAARAHSRNPNQSLYGILDAEAACIILENYYKDNGDGAEQVEVPAHMLQHYSGFWEQRRKREGEMLRTAQKERGDRLQWRKETMERDRQLELDSASASGAASKKKKKKKRKK